ncbi:tRNA adenosine deaminase-associated protein [Thermopolyspora flexuosa]|uniref:tRNA adenosine deaminase-associated protein n=1 Tax=Thermopolyspora flexuosa TaxID=103836 RepID=UPI003570EDAF
MEDEEDDAALSFAIAVYREDDQWEADMLPFALTSNLDRLIHALRQQPSISGTIGLVDIGDEFFVALRVLGDRVSVFLSDITAAWDWPLAEQVLEYLDIPVPDEEELEAVLQEGKQMVLPVGDLSIFADLGMDEMELVALSGDRELLPDEVLSSIAARLGFSQPYERAVDAALG